MICQVCAATLKDGAICPECAARLVRTLQTVAPRMADLAVTVHRLDRVGAPGPGGGSGDPVSPVNFDALERGLELRCVLIRWGLRAAAARGPEGWGSDHPAALAGFLIRHKNWIRSNPVAGTIYTQITDAVRKVTAAVDLPPDHKNAAYAGPCGNLTPWGACRQELWAFHGAREVQCPACAGVWDVAARRRRALAAADDELVTAATATKALNAQGVTLAAGTVSKWRQRGYLETHGESPAGPRNLGGGHLYRLGDILDLIDQATERHTRLTRRPLV